jgi:hypothetical protein
MSESVAQRWGRVALRTVAAAYLVGLWLDAAGCSVPARVLPRAVDFFMQIAALFPEAATGAIDYRAEGWVCQDARWEEIDTRAYFPLDPDDKENRFQRAMSFYRDDTRVKQALEAYLVARHNAGAKDDGIVRDHLIGGVRLLRVKVPIPPLGVRPRERYTRRPLDGYPRSEREVLYRTAKERIDERCGGPATPGPEQP